MTSLIWEELRFAVRCFGSSKKIIKRRVEPPPPPPDYGEYGHGPQYRDSINGNSLLPLTGGKVPNNGYNLVPKESRA